MKEEQVVAMQETTNSDITEVVIVPEGKKTLWNIAAEFSEFDQFIGSINPEELSEEDAEKLQQFQDDLENERDKKLDNCGKFIRNMEDAANVCLSEATRFQVEADRLTNLGNSRLKKADYVKNLIKRVFKSKGWKKIPTTYFEFTRTEAGGTPAVIVEPEYENDPSKLPERFVKKVPEFQKDAFEKLHKSEDPKDKAIAARIIELGIVNLKPTVNKDEMKTVLKSGTDEERNLLVGKARFAEKKDDLKIK